MNREQSRDRFRRIAATIQPYPDRRSGVVEKITVAVVLLCLLHVAIFRWKVQTKPYQVCGPCREEEANPGIKITRGCYVPAWTNRTCPRCGEEWGAADTCLFGFRSR